MHERLGGLYLGHFCLRSCQATPVKFQLVFLLAGEYLLFFCEEIPNVREYLRLGSITIAMLLLPSSLAVVTMSDQPVAVSCVSIIKGVSDTSASNCDRSTEALLVTARVLRQCRSFKGWIARS